MSGASEQQKLSKVAHGHSYQHGFNGRLGKYRIRLIDEYSRSVARDVRVLEIGAGEGPITHYLSERFGHVTAIEPADPFFAALESRWGPTSNVSLRHGLFETVPLEEQYPLIIASGVLEHVAEPQRFLCKVKDALTSDGVFLATVPNATSLHRRVGQAMGLLREIHELNDQDHRVGHYRYYDFVTLRGELESSGLAVDAMEGILLKPLPNSQMEQLTEDLCDALFTVGRTLPEWGAEIFVCARRGASS